MAAVGRRHFVYHSNTGRGDSGGAVISLGGELVGLHLGGWNDASPPPSPIKGAGAAAAGGGGGGGAGGKKSSKQAHGAAGAAIIKNKNRAIAMGIVELGTATRKSILMLSEDLSAGGYAIYLGSPAVAALCSAPRSSAAAGGSDSSAGAGSKRKAGAAGLGSGAGGEKKPK